MTGTFNLYFLDCVAHEKGFIIAGKARNEQYIPELQMMTLTPYGRRVPFPMSLVSLVTSTSRNVGKFHFNSFPRKRRVGRKQLSVNTKGDAFQASVLTCTVMFGLYCRPCPSR